MNINETEKTKKINYVISRLINIKNSLDYDKVVGEYLQNTINELKDLVLTDKDLGEGS